MTAITFIRFVLLGIGLLECVELFFTHIVWGQDRAMEIFIKHHPQVLKENAYMEFRNHLILTSSLAVLCPLAFFVLTLITHV